ncbi:MAG: 1-acyl-sn-glycerol-3-phosphate acyltransferase [Phaeodactylibacter sp.]|nr:1-acyl-sn-glycerol-3-phosphate acyltransferase [Phaeodactylibacter sp.]MCB9300827.1 1-acyl-sn-glycerol-3-phosphate acyltransferase [Lewinellaceae bacterium]HQU59513.1 1-acyl-sn-glycerol-3-phosphate acyltransferase [Saprospiraceae bacterium]
MWKRIAELLLRLSGWSLAPEIPVEVQRCIIIAVPHTSNWDIWYARLGFYVMDVPLRFTIKQEWMRFPFNLLVGPMGGLPIDRRPRPDTGERPSYVDVMAGLFEKHQRIAVMITPEGTRARRTQWKTGFYYAALKAGVPICLGYLDYAKKEAGVGPALYPTGNLEADMRKIMDFYRNIKGKYPELFSLDERFG